jgi:sugar-specific transcriptional regulator TrmB
VFKNGKLVEIVLSKMMIQDKEGPYFLGIYEYRLLLTIRDFAVIIFCMNIHDELMRIFGLTENEARVYLYALEREACAPRAITLEQGIPRPTVYHVLQSLIEKGLMTKTRTATGVAFRGVKPAQLPSLLQGEKVRIETREQLLKELLPSLQERHQLVPMTEETVRYEGLAGIKLLFEEALYCKERRWDIVAPSQNVLRQVEKRYAEYVYEAQRERGIRLRTLWENKAHATPHSPEEIRRRNIRLMPKVMTGRFSCLVILFDDACAIFSPLEQSSATLLRSKEIHSTFRAIFDGLWELSTPYLKDEK